MSPYDFILPFFKDFPDIFRGGFRLAGVRQQAVCFLLDICKLRITEASSLSKRIIIKNKNLEIIYCRGIFYEENL